MNLLGQLSNLGLLLDVEVALVDAVSDDVFAQLTAGHVMEYAALFAGIDHFTIVQRSELFGQLRFLGELRQHIEDGVVDRTGAVVESELSAHRRAVALDALCAVFAGHFGCEVDALDGKKLLIGRQSIHVLPGNHVKKPPWLKQKCFCMICS